MIHLCDIILSLRLIYYFLSSDMIYEHKSSPTEKSSAGCFVLLRVECSAKLRALVDFLPRTLALLCGIAPQFNSPEKLEFLRAA